jgi:hypothetical protein
VNRTARRTLATVSGLARGAVVAALALATGIQANPLTPASNERWVDATRLLLRARPEPEGKVLGYLVTNSSVVLSGQDGTWCQVSAGALQGYVACRYLRATPIDVAALNSQIDLEKKPQEQLELLQKRFWLQPSYEALSEYGGILDQVLVSSEQLQREVDVAPNRPRRPEYEAMKQRLIDGWKQSKAVAQGDFALADAISLAVLPKIKPSLLKSRAITSFVGVFPAGENERHRIAVDSIVGLSGTALQVLASQVSVDPAWFRARTFGLPQHQHYGGYAGSWDIGGIEVPLPGGGVEILSLGVDGTFQRSRIIAYDTRDASPGIGCDFIGHFVLNKAINPAFAVLLRPDVIGVKSVKLLQKRELSLQSPWVTDMLKRVQAQNSDAWTTGPGQMVSFDLNGDGVADIAYLGVPVAAELMGGNAASYYQNIAGRWYHINEFLPVSCGC